MDVLDIFKKNIFLFSVYFKGGYILWYLNFISGVCNICLLQAFGGSTLRNDENFDEKGGFNPVLLFILF